MQVEQVQRFLDQYSEEFSSQNFEALSKRHHLPNIILYTRNNKQVTGFNFEKNLISFLNDNLSKKILISRSKEIKLNFDNYTSFSDSLALVRATCTVLDANQVVLKVMNFVFTIIQVNGDIKITSLTIDI
jgi:hypothetical protein